MSVLPERFDLNAPALSMVASSSYLTEPSSQSMDSGSTESRGSSKLYLLSVAIQSVELHIFSRRKHSVATTLSDRFILFRERP